MKTKNKMMITLLLITTITAGLFPVNAATNTISANSMTVERLNPKKIVESTTKPVLSQAKPQLAVNDLSELDESSIDNKISEAVDADPNEENTGTPLWYLYAYGYSIPDGPTVDATEKRIRVKLQMVASKVKNTEFGALYKVHWGRVTHDGEQHTVSGYAVLDSDGVFYMKLEGEIAFKSIGRIHAAQYGVSVSMKGYIVDDGITYSHTIKGRALPLTPNLYPRLRNHLQ